jgi:hypothetical protein
MSILSWLGIKQRFMRRSAIDEFDEFIKQEKGRLKNADTEFNEKQYDKAVELVMRRLKRKGAQS